MRWHAYLVPLSATRVSYNNSVSICGDPRTNDVTFIQSINAELTFYRSGCSMLNRRSKFVASTQLRESLRDLQYDVDSAPAALYVTIMYRSKARALWQHWTSRKYQW